MSVTKLPSGRWRAQVYAEGRNVSVSAVLGGPGTFDTKTQAKQASAKARDRLRQQMLGGTTVAAWRSRWITDPLFARPKASTNLHNAERTAAFAARHGHLQVSQVTDQIVAEWIAGGLNTSTVPALRALFNDAASAKAGRLVEGNPFARLGLPKSRGNRDRQPPTEQQIAAIIHAAGHVACPAFAAWLQVGCFSGLRPGELDALMWDAVDLEEGWLHVHQQYSSRTRTFTLPKNGLSRKAPLNPPAREALLALPRDSNFCFRSLRGSHWTPSSRAYHWKATKAAAGWTGSLYLATRHFAGWYMINILLLPSEDVAIALGHTDGGELVRRLYGHRDQLMALERVRRGYRDQSNRARSSSVERVGESPHDIWPAFGRGGSAGVPETCVNMRQAGFSWPEIQRATGVSPEQARIFVRATDRRLLTDPEIWASARRARMRGSIQCEVACLRITNTGLVPNGTAHETAHEAQDAK